MLTYTPADERPQGCGGFSETRGPTAPSWRCSQGNYTASLKVKVKVLDFVKFGGPAGIRTQDTKIKSLMPYQAELPALSRRTISESTARPPSCRSGPAPVPGRSESSGSTNVPASVTGS